MFGWTETGWYPAAVIIGGKVTGLRSGTNTGLPVTGLPEKTGGIGSVDIGVEIVTHRKLSPVS